MAKRQRSREQWRRLVANWPGSGLTQLDYCARHGVSLASLRRWRRIFQAERETGARDRGEQPRLVPVQLVEDGPVSALTLVLAGGLRIEIVPGFDGPTLARLLGVLRAAA